MKRILTFILSLVILLTSCSSVITNETSGNIEANVRLNTSGNLFSDEEIYRIFSILDESAFPILCWYFSDALEDLDIAAESAYAPYYKVGRFSTIDEMKFATDDIFTDNFANEFFYDHAFIDGSGNNLPMYKEIDGELYRNINVGGFSWPYETTDEYFIPYTDDENIVITVKTLLPYDEINWFSFLLKNESESWKLDSYYQFNPHMQYSSTFTKQREAEIMNAISSWFCAVDWTDANQLDANALINFYLYTYLYDITEEYDYEKGYEVSAADVMDGLSVYLNNLKMETLMAVNENPYANARYDEETDNFYFLISFDPASHIVVNSDTAENVTTLEIMIIGKNGFAAYISFLDLEINGSDIKFIGNTRGKKFDT